MEITERDCAVISYDVSGWWLNQLTPLSLNKVSDHLYLTTYMTDRYIALFLVVHNDILRQDNSSIIPR